MKRPSTQSIRDELAATKAFSPNDTARISNLEADLKVANAEDREKVRARKAVLDGMLIATHVRLVNGWVEVVHVDAPKHEVVVANGYNRAERVTISKVLEVRLP